MIETTFVMIKGDAVRRGLIGRILSRFEDKGLKIAAMKMVSVTDQQVRKLYGEHDGKPFYERLVGFTKSTPVVVMKVKGNFAVSVVRALIGATDSTQAAAGTIRGDFGCSVSNRNLIHASRSDMAATLEADIFFGDSNEAEPYDRCDEGWTTEKEFDLR